MPGEIHAVLGENGAGKSTLMKIVYGVVEPDAGTIRWNGNLVTIANPAQARALGIGMVFQHFSLFETLTVTENIALSLDAGAADARLGAEIADVSARYGLPLDPRRHVHTMSVGERQRVEIVRCLLQRPQLLIMDEPTSVLTPQAIDKLLRRCGGSPPRLLDFVYQSQARRDSACCVNARRPCRQAVTGSATETGNFQASPE